MNVMVKDHRAEQRDEVGRILSKESLSAMPIDLPRFLQTGRFDDLLLPRDVTESENDGANIAPLHPVADSRGDAAGPADSHLPASGAASPMVSAAGTAIAVDDAPAPSQDAPTHHLDDMVRQLRESLARLDASFVAQHSAEESGGAQAELAPEQPSAAETLRNEPARPTSPFPPATYRIRPPATKPTTVFGVDPRLSSVANDSPPPAPVLKKPATPIMPPQAPTPVTRTAAPSRKPTLSSLFRAVPPAGPKEASGGTKAKVAAPPRQREGDDGHVNSRDDLSAIIVAPVSERTFVPRPVGDVARAAEGLEPQPVVTSYFGEMFERIRAQEEREAAEIEGTVDEDQGASEPTPDDSTEATDERHVDARADESGSSVVDEDLNLELLSDRDLEDVLTGQHAAQPALSPTGSSHSARTTQWPVAAPALLILAAGNAAAAFNVPEFASEIAYGSSVLMTIIAAGILATRKVTWRAGDDEA